MVPPFSKVLIDSGLDLRRLGKYDIVLCFNSGAHSDPFAFIQLIKQYLTNDISYLYFTMPSFLYIDSESLLQNLFLTIGPISLESLRALFGRCGLEVCSLRSVNCGNDLEAIVRYEKRALTALSAHSFHSLIKEIDDILLDACSSNYSVSFWGAGHRSLTLISQLNVDLIDNIVDSATFKQGKYCPATRLQIISPQKFVSEPSEFLFLSLPGLYSSEVLSFLSSKRLQFKVFILLMAII